MYVNHIADTDYNEGIVTDDTVKLLEGGQTFDFSWHDSKYPLTAPPLGEIPLILCPMDD